LQEQGVDTREANLRLGRPTRTSWLPGCEAGDAGSPARVPDRSVIGRRFAEGVPTMLETPWLPVRGSNAWARAVVGNAELDGRLGRKRGFPTANVRAPSEIELPADWVGGWFIRDRQAGSGWGASLGVRPTVLPDGGRVL
jgi:hypothetical protein